MFVFTLFCDCIHITLYTEIAVHDTRVVCEGGWGDWNETNDEKKEEKKSKFSGHWIWITGHLSYKFRGCHIEAGEKKKTCRAFSLASRNLYRLCSFFPHRRCTYYTTMVKNFGAFRILYTYFRFSTPR